MTAGILERLAERGVLRPFDTEVGRCLQDLDGASGPTLGLLAASASLAVSQGHSCLPLAHLGDVLREAAPDAMALPELPSIETLRAQLGSSRWAAQASADVITPLVYDEADRLWLGRYFHYERQVAEALHTRMAGGTPAADAEALRDALAPFFALDPAAPDAQAVAALTGLVSPLTVITGGPGTGKTTTVFWLLAAWIGLRLRSGLPVPRIRLAAPTGKAAARLGESLRHRLERFDGDAVVRAAIPQEASTLHRLLGVRLGSTRFRHHADHPLDADMVVVDEVSMVDLPLMAKLLDALPSTAALVLLGDRDQLASVEAGNVLAAICAAAADGAVAPARARLVEAVTGWAWPSRDGAPCFAGAVVALSTSHRFKSDSGLARLAALVRDGDVEGVRDGLAAGAFVGVAIDREAAVEPGQALLRQHLDGFAALAGMTDPQAALAAASRQRILTAMRDGAYGSVALNAAFDLALRRRAGVPADQARYAGQLLLVTRNDYTTGLFNGDVGVVLADAGGTLRAWFPDADGGVRKLALSLLPECESAWVMTIHKSQGSEFDTVAIVLPAHDARVLGRELLYTAVTRARERVCLIATDATLATTIGRSTRRYSGLADRLRAPVIGTQGGG